MPEAPFRRCIPLVAVGLTIGCVGTSTPLTTGTQSASSAGAGSTIGNGSSSGTTQSPPTSGASSVAATGTSGGRASSSGTGTGGSSSGGTTGSPFVDGGYVFCTAIVDGGPVSWMCTPGTYFCDPSTLGNCFECRSDSDCANQDSPTFDRDRPRCDLSSGYPGFQNFCQQCLDDADCAASSAGPLCDLDPSYPPGALEPAIALGGFEACGRLQTDCRLDGGPSCDGLDQKCDPATGMCLARSIGCVTDQDCQGLIYPDYPFDHLPASVCLHNQCGGCSDVFCPPLGCNSDALCGNPSSSDAGLTCDFSTGQCQCTSSAQCGGHWPVCVGMDGGQLNQFGEAAGSCGCDDSAQCGDGGLVCIPMYPPLAGYCGIPCTSPDYPPCGAARSGYLPICEPDSGLCVPCSSDQQCVDGAETDGPICMPGSGGTCGCGSDADCASGKRCEPQPGTASACADALPQCDRASCPQKSFCDWDSGECISSPLCLQDSDCYPGQPFCDPKLGACVECRDGADCVKSGRAAEASPFCLESICTEGCQSDQDCAAVPEASSCVNLDGGSPFTTNAFCGCAADVDCASSLNGHHCDTGRGDDGFGYCGCDAVDECPSQYGCRRIYGDNSLKVCDNQCSGDQDCGSKAFCDPELRCRSRCDTGHTCPGSEPICDTGDDAGLNGQSFYGAAPGVTWCYQCRTANDCPAGQACASLTCGFVCASDGDCRSDEACNSGVCRAKCDIDPCPAGLVCDILGVAGVGKDVCLSCVTTADCANGQSCDRATHVCGAVGNCESDCPPGDVCSSFWSSVDPTCDPTGLCDVPELGVCLENCDRASCPADRPRCAVIPSLTVEHSYCVACLGDADCADAGPGAWCDVSLNRTFQCEPPVPK